MPSESITHHKELMMKLKQIASALMVLGISPLAFADFTIQDIRIEGLQRTEPSTVFNYLPVKIGDAYNDGRGGEIIKSLYATGFFDDVRVESADGQLLLPSSNAPPSDRSISAVRKSCKTTLSKKISSRSDWRSRNTSTRRHSTRQSQD